MPGPRSGSGQPQCRSRRAARVWGQARVPPPPSPLQLHWEDRFPQPPLVLVRLSAWVDTSQASRGAVMGLMATSAAPGDLEPQGRAPVPPGAASIGVIPLLLQIKG